MVRAWYCRDVTEQCYSVEFVFFRNVFFENVLEERVKGFVVVHDSVFPVVCVDDLVDGC